MLKKETEAIFNAPPPKKEEEKPKADENMEPAENGNAEAPKEEKADTEMQDETAEKKEWKTNLGFD